MITPPLPDNESSRLKALWRCTMRDRRKDPVIERITSLVAAVFQVPYVLVSLVDEECQWFKSHHGLKVTSTPRAFSFCAHAILHDGCLEVPDAARDERFLDNPLVTGSPFIRYYLGAPLRSSEGMPIGTLCLIDSRPRALSTTQQAQLETLADLVMQRLEVIRLSRQEEVVTHSGLGLWELDITSGSTWWNSAVYRLYGVEDDFVHDQGSGLAAYVDSDRARLEACLAEAIDQQRAFDENFQIQRIGAQRPCWVRITGTPILKDTDTTHVAGTIQDITRQIRHEQKLRRLQRLDSAVNRLQSHFIGGDDLAETFNGALEALLALTDSESGFIGEVHHDAKGAPFLQTHAISDLSWDDASRARYLAAAPEGMRFTRLDSLFGAVLRSGELLISNQADQDPRSGGLPPGHPPLHAFMGIPVIHDRQLVAMVGLANRPGGYTPAQAEELAPFLRSLGQLVESLRLRDQHRQAQQRLKLASRVFADSEEAIFFTDAHQRIVEVNNAFVDISGRARDAVIGERATFIELVSEPACSLEASAAEAWQQKRWRGEAVIRHANGSQVPIHLMFSPASTHGEEPGYGVGIFSDLTKFKRHAEALYLASHTDELTGLPNRNAFVSLMQRALSECGHDHAIAVSLLDLDDFAQINNTIGREGADRVLIKVTNTLRQTLNPRDQLARLGGDEFAIIHRDYDGTAGAFQRVLHALEALDHEPRITASLGVTLCPQDDTDPDTLLRHANQAMYRAKAAGGNDLAFFDLEQHQQMRKRLAVVSRVGEGLVAQEFVLHFQPQIDIASSRLVGVEALARWQHPQLGTCLPDSFLPELVGSDVELAFDTWVIDTALATLSDWYRRGHSCRISINLAPRSLGDQRFIETLTTALAHYPEVPNELLCIEVLESAALDDIATATKVMQHCRQLGVSLALDDFGTGYSSLTYLRDFPVDIVKIDKSFVINMLDDDKDLAIVEGIIFMAQRFGKRVVAEGADSARHIERLRTMGCNIAQGFGIAKPMPASELLKWWQSQPPA